jgi:translation initiation factor 5B
MSTTDAVNAFLNQLNINNPSSSSKNKKKKKTDKTDKTPELTITNEELVKKTEKTKTKPLSTVAKLALQRKKLIEDEEARLKAIQEEEERKVKEEEEKLEFEKKKLEEKKALKKQKEKDKIHAQKEAGTYKTEKQKEKDRFEKLKLEQMMNAMNKAKENITVELELKQKNDDFYGKINFNYKSIISCVMGHVDTGKTSILDKIRDTTVQKGEVGGITQQIGATFIPRETLKEKTSSYGIFPIQVPGILMIDTPGHGAFKNLRSMGSNICNIAILVIDLVHGLEPQTIESMKLLKESNTPFIIALNKIDRLYGWISKPNESFIKTFETQESSTQDEFDNRLNKIIVQIMEQGLNAKLYWKNDSPDDTISICPTSAITGEGLSDLLATLINWSQNRLKEEITFTNKLECILMETTKVEGYGLTLDVILINGELKVGDEITIKTNHGLLNTNIRNLLTPPPNRETRVKTEFIQHENVKGSIGVKLIINGLENTGIPGSKITFQNENLQNSNSNLENLEIKKFKLDDFGVTVFASTMGSLEALLTFLQTECKPPIPVSQVGLGKVMKKDVIKTHITNEKSLLEFKTILAFNVEVDEEVIKEANNKKVKIFKAEIIYHLFDQYTKYKKELFGIRKEAVRDKMSFPCTLKILENCIFNKKNPLVFGVEVLEGNLHIGTHLTNPITNTYIGKVISIQNNHKDVDIGKKTSSVCIKVDNQENQNIAYGRQFDHNDTLYSRISRESLDVLKEYYKEDCSKDDLLLIVKLKKLFNIV